MRQRTQPLDPDSEGGKAAAEALTAFLAEVGPKVRRRRREREAAEAAAKSGEKPSNSQAASPHVPMRVEQEADALSVSRASATRLVSRPDGADLLPASKDRGVWQVDRQDVAGFIDQHSVTPEGQEPITVSADVLPRLHTLAEVSASTGLPLRWLQDGCRHGRLPHVRAGRARLMTQAQVDRVVKIASVNDEADDEFAADRAAYASGRRSSRRPAIGRT